MDICRCRGLLDMLPQSCDDRQGSKIPKPTRALVPSTPILPTGTWVTDVDTLMLGPVRVGQQASKQTL